MEEKKKIRINILQEDESGVYADNGIYYEWNEIELDPENSAAAWVLPPPPPRIVKFKCKPTYNFQSIEFEVECHENNLEPMFALYRKVVEGLIAVTPSQPNQPQIKPASAKQLEIMDKFRIPYQPGISYEDADRKIQESYNRAKNSRTY